MSLNTVIAFALLLKKITRKGSMKNKNFRNKKMRKPSNFNNTKSTSSSSSSNSNDNNNHQKQDNNVQISCNSSASSSDDDDCDLLEEDDDLEEEEQVVVMEYNTLNKKSNSSIISLSSIKSSIKEKHNSLNDIIQQQRSSLLASNDDIKQDLKRISLASLKALKSAQADETVINDETTNVTIPAIVVEVVENDAGTTTHTTSLKLITSDDNIEVIVRDFAYAIDSPLHFGKPLNNKKSIISLSSPDFNGRDARALFDFSPETEYEIGLKAGQSIWVQYRQCPGWLIADVQDETGLIPESYVEFI